MSVLQGKHILVLGEENQHIKELEEVFEAEGMVSSVATCGTIDIASIESKHIDLVLLNHLHEGESCIDFLKQLRGNRSLSVLPIFALVENTEEKIQRALMLGAADYITNDEPMVSVINKMKIVFGEADNFSECIQIDITPSCRPVGASGVKVYLIEDDPLLRNLLLLRLEKSNFMYEFSKGGEGAIEAMVVFKPQVVILDIMLPDKSGFEILAEMRSIKELKDTPVIIFSNRDEQSDTEKAHELGVSKYYVKAMTDLSVLVKTIEELAQ